MIGKLTGMVTQKQPPQLLIEVNGVGYEVLATMNTFYNLPDSANPVSLFTHLIVREDAHILFGFHDTRERSLFRTLIKVNGVGPKLALGILSGIEADRFVQCVQDKDASSLVRIPGVGKKTAERLIVEMRDKLDDWQSTLPGATLTTQTSHDAVCALITLGYKPNEAERAVKNSYNANLSSEQLIREALKAMMV